MPLYLVFLCYSVPVALLFKYFTVILTKNTTFMGKCLVAKEIMCKFAADKFK